MRYKFFEPIARVSFRTFIAWQIGRSLDKADKMALDDEIIDYYNSTDPLLDNKLNTPSLDEFKRIWECNYTVYIYEMSIGPNGFHEIGFMVDNVQYSQDFDLSEISIPKLFEYAY